MFLSYLLPEIGIIFEECISCPFDSPRFLKQKFASMEILQAILLDEGNINLPLVEPNILKIKLKFYDIPI